MNSRESSRFNPELMRRQLDLLLVEPGDVVELRIVTPKGAKASGYFDNADAAIEAIRPWALDEHIDTIFVLLNPPQPACWRRYANRMQPASPRVRGEFPKETTSDGDVLKRRWLLIDCDAERPSGVSASDEERGASRTLATDIYGFLKGQGIDQRSLATMTSGNGFYVLVRIDLPNDEASRKLCEDVLKGLAATFPGEGAHVDVKCFNAGRIAALCGTTKGKGDNLPEAPHRMVKPIVFPSAPIPAPVEALERIAALSPKPQKPAAPSARPGRPADGPFDAAAWLAKFPQVELLDGPVASSGGWTRWYVRCPWDGSHAGKDAYLSVSASGAVTFHCSHNSCSGRDWKALRELVGDVPPRSSAERPRPTPRPKPDAPAGAGEEISDVPDDFWAWTDVGNKERVLHHWAGLIRYDAALGWHVWNERLWCGDTGAGLVRHRIEQVLVAMGKTVPGIAVGDEDLLKKWNVFCTKSASARMVRNVLDLAEADPRVRTLSERWDADPWTLNCANGLLDLHTGEIRPHDPEALASSIADVLYDPDAQCPTWMACLERWQPSEDVRAFLQRHAGYCLTGATSEQMVVFHHGDGGNGKSKYTGTLEKLLGGYARRIHFNALTDEKRGGGQATPELARLAGARLAISSEIVEGRALDEAALKDWTGGDKVVARFLNQNPFEYYPQFKLVLYGNHKPRIRSQDEGIWRRLAQVPWDVKIPDAEKDPDLDKKLAAELPGILAWAVRGCLEWRRVGLAPPQLVQDASAAYREDENQIAAFVADCCVLQPRAWASSARLRSAYESWCKDVGEKYPLGPRAFTDRLRRLGAVPDQVRRFGDATRRGWGGIGLVDPNAKEPPAEPADLEMAAPVGGASSYSTPNNAPPADYAAPHKPVSPATSEEADPFGGRTEPQQATPARDPSALDVWIKRQFSQPHRPDEERGVTVVRAANLDELLERGAERGYTGPQVLSAANRHAQRAVPADRAWWNRLQAQPRHPRPAPESRHPATSSDNPEDWDIEDPFAE